MRHSLRYGRRLGVFLRPVLCSRGQVRSILSCGTCGDGRMYPRKRSLPLGDCDLAWKSAQIQELVLPMHCAKACNVANNVASHADVFIDDVCGFDV